VARAAGGEHGRPAEGVASARTWEGRRRRAGGRCTGKTVANGRGRWRVEKIRVKFKPPRRTVMTGGTNASERHWMNQRLRKTSVSRTVSATKLLDETHHRMVRRCEFITRQSSCARVCEKMNFSSAPDEPLFRNVVASVHPMV
jgi:hypothetical protein